MFFGTKLIKYQVSFGDPLNLWGFYSLTAPHYGKGSTQTLRFPGKHNNVIVISGYGTINREGDFSTPRSSSWRWLCRCGRRSNILRLF